MQQEDEYRIQMELNRYYLRKDSLSMGVSSEKSFYETETARTPSSRGKQRNSVLCHPTGGISLDFAFYEQKACSNGEQRHRGIYSFLSAREQCSDTPHYHFQV